MTSDELTAIITALVTVITAWIAAWQQVHIAQLKRVDQKVDKLNGHNGQ